MVIARKDKNLERMAREIVLAIIGDMVDRQGFQQAIHGTEPDTLKDILYGWERSTYAIMEQALVEGLGAEFLGRALSSLSMRAEGPAALDKTGGEDT